MKIKDVPRDMDCAVGGDGDAVNAVQSENTVTAVASSDMNCVVGGDGDGDTANTETAMNVASDRPVYHEFDPRDFPYGPSGTIERDRDLTRSLGAQAEQPFSAYQERLSVSTTQDGSPMISFKSKAPTIAIGGKRSANALRKKAMAPYTTKDRDPSMMSQKQTADGGHRDKEPKNEVIGKDREQNDDDDDAKGQEMRAQTDGNGGKMKTMNDGTIMDNSNLISGQNLPFFYI